MMKRYLLIALTLLVGLSTPVVAQQGMLKAFGLKGKVKTVTFEDDFTIAFDPQGNYIGTPDYKGGEVSIDVNEGRSCAKFVINNWKWTGWERSYGMGMSYDYTVTAYDQQNRPGKVSLECVGGGGYCDLKNIPVIYSGSDSHGNYTQINFDKTNVKGDDQLYLTPISVKCTYWPESATAADVAKPMSDAQAASLIKKANRLEQSALSKKLWEIINLGKSVPGYADGTAEDENNPIFYEDDLIDALIYNEVGYSVNVHEYLKIKIEEQRYSSDGESAEVFFLWGVGSQNNVAKYNVIDDWSQLRHAKFVFEDGQWKVSDLANGVNNEGSPGLDIYDWGTDWISERVKGGLEWTLEEINSGELERTVRQRLAHDPKLPQYLAKIEAFKKKVNGGSGRNSSSDQIFTAVEEAPSFIGGEAAMYRHLSQNIRYPETAALNGIQGRVTVQFVVEKDGSVGEVNVVRGKDPDLDMEAVRVIKSMPSPAFIPGKMNGQNVRVWYTLPINFKLGEEKKPAK